MAVERDTVERDAVERMAVERMAIERMTIERMAVERMAVAGRQRVATRGGSELGGLAAAAGRDSEEEKERRGQWTHVVPLRSESGGWRSKRRACVGTGAARPFPFLDGSGCRKKAVCACRFCPVSHWASDAHTRMPTIRSR